MKKTIIFLMATMLSVVATAQTITKMQIKVDNKVAYSIDINKIDSIVFVKEHAVEGAAGGKFSISTTEQVYFAQGNLQYQASTATWRFAENQWDMIGADNANISSTYDGWIDLFGWGTGSTPTLATTDNADYATFTDWGTNAISNGGNAANQWRTLTKLEWIYIFQYRPDAANLQGQATVNDVYGYVLLPDGTDAEGLGFTPNPKSWTTNTYTVSEWATLEAAGAIFLPAAGGRYGTSVDGINLRGNYYSSTTEGNASSAFFNSSNSTGDFPDAPLIGFSVRLVQVVK